MFFVLDIFGDASRFFAVVGLNKTVRVEEGGLSSGGGATVAIVSVHATEDEAWAEATRRQAALSEKE